MQLKYKIESRLVVATYVLNDVCMVSYFEFGGKSFHELHNEQIEPVRKCYDPI